MSIATVVNEKGTPALQLLTHKQLRDSLWAIHHISGNEGYLRENMGTLWESTNVLYIQRFCLLVTTKGHIRGTTPIVNALLAR